MEAIAKLTNIRISPRKAGLVCDMIRNKNAIQAQIILDTTDKKVSPIIRKLLDSAIANATNNHAMNASDLIIKRIVANPGPTIKRTLPRGKGSADVIRKRSTHIEITLTDNKNNKVAKVVQEVKKDKPSISKPVSPKPEVKVAVPKAKVEVKKEPAKKVEKKPAVKKPAPKLTEDLVIKKEKINKAGAKVTTTTTHKVSGEKMIHVHVDAYDRHKPGDHGSKKSVHVHEFEYNRHVHNVHHKDDKKTETKVKAKNGGKK